MAVKLNSTGGGSVTLDTPSTASNYTVTLPAANATLADTSSTQTLTNKTLTAAGSNTVEATSGPTSTQLAGMRNKIINGAFQVWQRGTTFTANGYGPDRWYLNVAGTTTFTQETSVIPSGAQYALKWTTGAASSYGQVRQWLEQLNVIPLRGLTVTASAMVQVSAGYSGNLQFEIGSCPTTDATSGSYTQVSFTPTGTATSAGFTKISATFTVPSNSVGLYIGVVPTLAQASGVSAYISQVQLEPGATATPFENRLYGTELMLCQRYYWKNLSTNATAALGGVGAFGSATIAYLMFQYPVPMRSAPTASYANAYIANGTNGWAVTSFGSAYIGPNAAQIQTVASAATATGGQAAYIYDAGSGIGYVAFSAEL